MNKNKHPYLYICRSIKRYTVYMGVGCKALAFFQGIPNYQSYKILES